MNDTSTNGVSVLRCIRQKQYRHAKVNMFANNTDVMIIAMGGSVAHRAQ